MGVTGLWTVVHPCARPVKVETLNRKRLAVDASIWIYQFLKAVRDKEGNALRNSHVVGFFRRICKLLFIGIKPVFVFDGGAPALKRQTINARKSRREGRREDAAKTAGKLLALQMQKRAEDEEQRRKDDAKHGRKPQLEADEGPLPENLVYADEVYMASKERQQTRNFRKKDAYHLPDLDTSLAEMGQPDDPRIMSLEELQQYARQFDTGEDINVYDFSKIDFDSPFFTSLPASDRYNILNAARLRSRLRMGYSKDQLDDMFPDRMAFSKFQIERVTERNELTQRLMNINGMNEDAMFGVNGTSRIASERNREYVLVKNDGVEGGWALGVVSNDKNIGRQEKPIDLDEAEKPPQLEEDGEWEEAEFEDVPIEGLNRLPKRPKPQGPSVSDILARDQERRQQLYNSRTQALSRAQQRAEDDRDDADSLFVAEPPQYKAKRNHIDATNLENVNDLVLDTQTEGEDAELQRAIALSLQSVDNRNDFNDDEYREVFPSGESENVLPPIGSGVLDTPEIARAKGTKAPRSGPFMEDSDDEEAGVQAERKVLRNSQPAIKPNSSSSAERRTQEGSFDGPLPFEKLDIGTSLLGKKKMQNLSYKTSGGFERQPAIAGVKEAAPLPPWFVGNATDAIGSQKAAGTDNRREEIEEVNDIQVFEAVPKLREQSPFEIIDVDALEDQKVDEDIDIFTQETTVPNSDEAGNSNIEMNSSEDKFDSLIHVHNLSVAENTLQRTRAHSVLHFNDADANVPAQPNSPPPYSQSRDDLLEWSSSDEETNQGMLAALPIMGRERDTSPPELSPEAEDLEFEDVSLEKSGKQPDLPILAQTITEAKSSALTSMEQVIDPLTAVVEDEDERDYSDPEDEELFRQLAQEQEEHVRFSAELNQHSFQQNFANYEKELKQLQNQQKKDRRDADEVTQTMIQECQQLLTLFGLPYVTAPMEAEAQCAELVRLGLVDGIVTDDSDCFLFGGTRVYKNVFNQAKFVECYLASDLEAEFGLTRLRLIAIAQLLGSDYTDGLPGIGPVTALEILSEFDNLAAFKDWWEAVQTTVHPKSADADSKFKTKFRKSQATKLFLSPSFPDPRVEIAYLEPEVDSDPSQFIWGVPDLEALRAFLMSTVGWSAERTDEILVPVIRDMNQRQQEGTQSNITRFFEGSVGAGAFAPWRRAAESSKRLESALHRMGEKARNPIDGAAENQLQEQGVSAEGTTRSGKRRKAATKSSIRESPDDEVDKAAPRKKARKVRGRTS